jgi:hypothetical protein
MKKIVLLVIVAAISIYQVSQEQVITRVDTLVQYENVSSNSNNKGLEAAFNNRLSDSQVQDEGFVIRILPDDLDGSRHQKFILKNKTGQTVLVAHNIDLAPRIPALKIGDKVAFFGEYEWNSRGGVIHWTHHDPNGYHIAGWLKAKGKSYQ